MKIITTALVAAIVSSVWASPIVAPRSNLIVEEFDIQSAPDGTRYIISSDGIINIPDGSSPATAITLPKNSQPAAAPASQSISANPGKLDSPERDRRKPGEIDCWFEGQRVLVAGIYKHIDDVCNAFRGIYMVPEKIWRTKNILNGRGLTWYVNTYNFPITYDLGDCVPEMRNVQDRCSNYASQGYPEYDRGFYGGWYVSTNGNVFTLVKTSKS
ncbi:hypothetical protein BJ508DRAFT_306948 [Ascobolus immersus RN42]|uniref:Ecp2 effector protein domain-containing protein n=1 Tax=Ascobolus immersus RN42 TaxID=1160509 RepID=A0A3N4IH65_ASCIM|nr:hypothetical protein BJ508DRAFT_306948 [Ascobolus immersus RN42]